MNQFKAKLYEEFEDNAFKLMGVSGDRVREVLGKRGENIDADFEAAWRFGGAPFMRQEMSMTIAILELVYHETKIDRKLTDQERTERYASWDIGLDPETVDKYFQKKQEQKTSAEHQ